MLAAEGGFWAQSLNLEQASRVGTFQVISCHPCLFLGFSCLNSTHSTNSSVTITINCQPCWHVSGGLRACSTSATINCMAGKSKGSRPELYNLSPKQCAKAKLAHLPSCQPAAGAAENKRQASMSAIRAAAPISPHQCNVTAMPSMISCTTPQSWSVSRCVAGMPPMQDSFQFGSFTQLPSQHIRNSLRHTTAYLCDRFKTHQGHVFDKHETQGRRDQQHLGPSVFLNKGLISMPGGRDVAIEST